MTGLPLNIAFAITLLTVAVLLGALIYYRRKLGRSRRAFQELAQRFQGVNFQKSMFRGDLIEGQHGGIAFTCRYFMGSRNSPPSLTIQVCVSCPAKLTIRREAWYDRFATRIGLVAELRTGDPGFDQAYFFDTDREDIYKHYLAEEAKRREIDALFGLGFPVREIVFRKQDLRIVLSPIKGDEIPSVPAEKYLDALLNLSAGLSYVGYPASFASPRFPGSSRPPIPRVKLAFLFIANGLFILGGAGALAYGMHRYEPLGNGLIVNALALSAPAALVFLILVFRWIRGRSSSHRLFLYVLILSFIGFPLIMTGGAVSTNGFLDRGSETSHQVLVTDHYYRQNKNNRTYYVAFPSWQRSGQTDRISVHADFFRTVCRGDGIVIRTKPGYWQEEWIAGIEKMKTISSRSETAAGIRLAPRGVRFYEGGPSTFPKENRTFAAEFSPKTARFIYCQVDMGNELWQERDRLYTFVWQYINPHGSLLAEISMPFTVQKQWKTAWVSQSWGWNEPGHWPPGDYTVIVVVDGRPFGKGTFSIR